VPPLSAFAFRHSRGLPYVFPHNDLDYIGNFVNMTFEIGGKHEGNNHGDQEDFSQGRRSGKGRD